MGEREKIILHPVFLQAGRLARKAGIMSGKAVYLIKKELVSLDIKKGYLAEKILSTDVLYLRKLIEVKPQSADSYYNLGTALMDKKRFNEAALYFKKAALWNANHIQAYLGMARAYLNLRKYGEAINALEKAAAHGGKAEVFYELGLVYDKKGMAEKAVDSLEKALELNPKLKKARDALDSLNEDKAHESKKRKK